MWIQSCPYWAQHMKILNVGGSKMRALGPGISVCPCRERSLSLSLRKLWMDFTSSMHLAFPSKAPSSTACLQHNASSCRGISLFQSCLFAIHPSFHSQSDFSKAQILLCHSSVLDSVLGSNSTWNKMWGLGISEDVKGLVLVLRTLKFTFPFIRLLFSAPHCSVIFQVSKQYLSTLSLYSYRKWALNWVQGQQVHWIASWRKLWNNASTLWWEKPGSFLNKDDQNNGIFEFPILSSALSLDRHGYSWDLAHRIECIGCA